MTYRRIWMLGTSPNGKGGIASVLQQYLSAGWFEGNTMHFESTHHDRSLAGRFLPFILCAFKLTGALLLRRVSLVHIHSSYGGSFWRKLLLALPAIGLSIPVVIHLHGSKFMEFYSSGAHWRRYWIRWLFRHCFRVVALSDEWKEWILQVEPKTKVAVVFNSLAITTGQTSSKEIGPTPTVLFLGRIGERKGIFDLLRAFASVRKSSPNARLVVGGDGDIERFNALVQELGLVDSVEYIGWANNSQKMELLQRAWVLALPSYQEGLPMAILEAMAFSRAVVTCPVGGIPQAVEHGSTGFLVKPGDTSALAKALASLLVDAELTSIFGKSGRKVFELKFSNEANWQKLFAIYRDADAQISTLEEKFAPRQGKI